MASWFDLQPATNCAVATRACCDDRRGRVGGSLPGSSGEWAGVSSLFASPTMLRWRGKDRRWTTSIWSSSGDSSSRNSSRNRDRREGRPKDDKSRVCHASLIGGGFLDLRGTISAVCFWSREQLVAHEMSRPSLVLGGGGGLSCRACRGEGCSGLRDRFPYWC